jgi:DcmR-like sensory protein
VSLLAEAPAGRHLAQIHRDRESLSESVYTFLEAGIRRDESVMVIADAELRDGVLDRLSQNKTHPQAASHSGQLEVLDAAKVMAGFMPRTGVPEWSRFRATLAPIVSRALAFGRGLRICTEMSSMLWITGNTESAIQIEELWNALARLHIFSLYCGYTLDTHSEQSYAGPLEEIGHNHSDILGTDDDERFGVALDRASKEIFGITLSQMAGMTNQDGARRFPSGQRTMLWVKRNLPLSTAQLADRARRYFQETGITRA